MRQSQAREFQLEPPLPEEMSGVTVLLQTSRQVSAPRDERPTEHFKRVKVAEDRIADLRCSRREIGFVEGAVQQGSRRDYGPILDDNLGLLRRANRGGKQ